MGLFDKFKKKNFNIIEINDKQFGKIIIKHDIDNGIYRGEIENAVDFGGDLIDVGIYCSDDNNIEKIISVFKSFYNKSSILKNRVYLEFTNFLKTNGVYDEEGNKLGVTEQFLRENLIFHVELGHGVNGSEILLYGDLNINGILFGCSVYYNVAKDEFDYSINWA